MYKINYTEHADFDLTAIFDYIAEDNKDRAITYLSEMEKSILLLSEFPMMGATGKFPELQALGIRMVVHDKYLIFYTVDQQRETVNIVRVLNGSVNYKKLFAITQKEKPFDKS